MSFHFIVSFDPQAAEIDIFREELLRVTEASRQEPGCLRMEIFESITEPHTFSIHSEWIDEGAFELHATLPHTVRFLSAAEKLLRHPVKGFRLRRLSPR